MGASKDIFAPPTKLELSLAKDPMFAPPSAEELKTHSRSSEAAIEGAGQAMTLGYLNNLQAATEPLTFYALNKLTGKDIKPDDYISARDSYIARRKDLQEKNPKSYYGGMAGGAVLSSALIPGGAAAEGASAAARIANAAKTGLTIGAASNPGDKEGEISDLQLNERLKNGLMGAILSTAIQSGAEGASALSQKTRDILKSLAEEKAVKAAGAMKRDMTALSEKGKVSELGRTLLDEGIVTPLATSKDVLSRSSAKANEAMGSVAKNIEKADELLGRSEGFNLENSTPDQINTFLHGQIKTSDIKNRVIADIRRQFPGVPEDELAPALLKVETWFGNRPEVMNAKELQELKVGLNNFLKKSDFYRDMPGISKEGLLAVRRGAKEAIEQKADAAAQIIGDPAGEIKAQNKLLGQLLEAQDLASDKVARDAANRSISLTDTIAGAGGAGAGTMIAGGPGAIAAGLGSMALNKGVRKYGDSLAATGADAVAKILTSASPKLSQLAENNPKAFYMIVQDVMMDPSFQKSQNKKLPVEDPNNAIQRRMNQIYRGPGSK